ncbi:uncharacterized protein LOC142333920 [Lycorma delicatula]|uniref:uncharacterized protein LOC142333920 n=1 Tax=Lycorma delicatula TaxID=130591 RepID=UPI003F51413E
MNIFAILFILIIVGIKDSQNIISYDRPESAVIFENDEVFLHADTVSFDKLNSKPRFVQVTGSYLDTESYYSILFVIGHSEDNTYEVIYCVLNLKGNALKEGVLLKQVKKNDIYIDYHLPNEMEVFNKDYDDQNMYVIFSPHSNPINKNTLKNKPVTTFKLDGDISELVQFSKENKINEFTVLKQDESSYRYIRLQLVRSKSLLNDIVRKKFLKTMTDHKNFKLN